MMPRLRHLWRLLRPSRASHVSDEWLTAQDVTGARAEWEGPRWRFPAERDRLAGRTVRRFGERRRRTG